MANETIKTNGAVKPQAGATPPARIIVPTEPVSGSNGEDILGSAIASVFLSGDERVVSTEDKPGGMPGRSEATAGAGEEEPQIIDLNAGDEITHAGGNAELPTDAGELAALHERAQASGVTPEVQHQAEVEELARLEEKAKKTGRTVEQVAAAEEGGEAREGTAGTKATEGTKTYTDAQVQELIQKRVANLHQENQQLKADLETARQNVGTGRPHPDGLEAITDAGKLAEFRATTDVNHKKMQRLQRTLQFNPAKVEAELRQMMGAEAAEGVEFTPETMMDLLGKAEDKFAEDLEAVPKRAQYLETAAKAGKLARTVHPWLADPTDAKTTMFNQFAAALPGIKQSPEWEYWMASAIEMHQLRRAHQAKLKAAPAAGRGGQTGRFIPKVKFPPSGGAGNGNGGGRAAAGGGERNRGLQRLKANPSSREALESVIAGLVT